MPKETKKFINPLLRPSQEVAPKQEVTPKQEVAPKPEKKPVSERPVYTETPTFTSTQTSTQKEELSMPTTPQAAHVSEPVNRMVLPSSPTMSATTSAKAPTEESVIYKERFPEQESSGNRTLPVSKSVPDGEETFNGYHQVPPSPAHKIYNTYNSDTYQSEAQPMRPSRTYSRTNSSTYTSTETPTDTSAPTDMEISEIYEPISSSRVRDAEVSPSFLDVPPAHAVVRRRRGAQSFEKTHERITLWIDKRLKQAFEDLAYEEELAKTALLNEAIADLLKKYNNG